MGGRRRDPEELPPRLQVCLWPITHAFRRTFQMHLHAAASLGPVIYHVTPQHIIKMIICI